MGAVTFNRTDLEWLGKLPATKAEGEAQAFDGRAWLAGYLKASARDRAETVYPRSRRLHGGRSTHARGPRRARHGRMVWCCWKAWASTMLPAARTVSRGRRRPRTRRRWSIGTAWPS